MRTVETEVGLKGILLVADTASRLERLEGGEGAGSICRLADGREHLLDAYHLHPGEHVVFALPVKSNRKGTSSLRRGYGRALSRSSDDGDVTRAEANFEPRHDSAAEIGYRIPVLSTVARAPAVSKLAGMDEMRHQTATLQWAPGLYDQLESWAQRSWNALVRMLHLTRQANPRVEMLRRIYLFDSCSERELELLATQADADEASAGEVLTVEGKPPHTFYMLLEGVVRVKTAGEADVKYGPGAAFDVVAMADRSPARATITAEGPVRMLVMSHAQFRAVAALPRLQDVLWRLTSPVAAALPLQPRHLARARL